MIKEAKYIGTMGDGCLINLGDRVSAFGLDIDSKVINQMVTGVSWINEHDIQKIFMHPIENRKISAYPTPDMQKMVVVYNDNKDIVDPNNAVVFNSDGSRYCQLFAPKRLSDPKINDWLPKGSLTGLMQVGWESDPSYMYACFYINDTDWIETRRLRVSDFQFDDTWRL